MLIISSVFDSGLRRHRNRILLLSAGLLILLGAPLVVVAQTVDDSEDQFHDLQTQQVPDQESGLTPDAASGRVSSQPSSQSSSQSSNQQSGQSSSKRSNQQTGQETKQPSNAVPANATAQPQPFQNPNDPQAQHLPSPYQNMPSLSDLYSQFPVAGTKLRRFGSDAFLIGNGGGNGGNANELPMDLPAGPDYILGPGDDLVVNIWGG
jgi:hypothetical protein